MLHLLRTGTDYHVQLLLDLWAPKHLHLLRLLTSLLLAVSQSSAADSVLHKASLINKIMLLGLRVFVRFVTRQLHSSPQAAA